MTDIIIRQPDPEPHEHEGSQLVAQANEAVIASNEDRELAGTVVAQLNSLIERITYEFDGSKENPGPVSLAHKAWKAGVALRDRALKGAEDAKAIWLQKVRKFEFAVEQKRVEEARKAQAKAQEEAEKKRKAQIAEAKRLGDLEQAAALKEAPLRVEAVAPKTPEVTKADGLRRSSPIWGWEYTNKSLIPRELWIPDEKEISARVKRTGPEANIPGISIFDTRSRGA